MTRRWWVVVLLAVAMGLHLAVAFAPYRLDPPRRVANGAGMDAGVLRIDGHASARTPQPPAWLRDVERGGQFVLHVTVRSLDPDQEGPARIVTIEENYTRANLVIGQEGEDLLVRFRQSGSDPGSDPPVLVPGLFADDELHEVTVTAGDGELVVSVDGARQATRDLPATALARWDPSYRLFVGDAAEGDRTWHGEVRKLEAGSGTTQVDYLDDGALEIPERFWYVPERLRDPIGWSADEGQRFWQVGAARFVSFVPVGVLAMAATRRRPGRVARALGVVVLLSVSIQLGKVLFAGRHPAVIDLAIELFGGAAGVAAWVFLERLRAAARPVTDRPVGEP